MEKYPVNKKVNANAEGESKKFKELFLQFHGARSKTLLESFFDEDELFELMKDMPFVKMTMSFDRLEEELNAANGDVKTMNQVRRGWLEWLRLEKRQW